MPAVAKLIVKNQLIPAIAVPNINFQHHKGQENIFHEVKSKGATRKFVKKEVLYREEFLEKEKETLSAGESLYMGPNKGGWVKRGVCRFTGCIMKAGRGTRAIRVKIEIQMLWGGILGRGSKVLLLILNLEPLEHELFVPFFLCRDEPFKMQIANSINIVFKCSHSGTLCFQRNK